METITLNQKQQRRADILLRLTARRISHRDAAQLLGVTDRHLRRLTVRFARDGLVSLVHGNTGRVPKHKTPPQTVDAISNLAGKDGKYQDFNVCHLHDKLTLEENIGIGRSTLDRLLKKQQLRRPTLKSREPLRSRRARRTQEGSLLQMDASPHDWLQGRAPKMTLIGSIDDATSKVVYLRFHSTESQEGYLLMLKTIVETYGVPESVYHDKHTILRSPKQATIEDELAGKAPMSQVQRVMDMLGIKPIIAHSPQAKGRIERLWQTLQDRLLNEMRVAGISTLEAANTFLPDFLIAFNARFACPPQEPQSAWVTLEEPLDADYYFAVVQSRQVKADHTLAWLGQIVQIVRDKGQPSLAGKKVNIHLTPEGTLRVYADKQPLRHRILPAVPAKQASRAPTDKPSASRSKACSARQRAWLYASPG
jgi:transposase